MLSLACAALAFTAPMISRPTAASRLGAPISMDSKTLAFDQDGVYEPAPLSDKPPVKILERIENLRVLSAVADAGLLSAAEEAGVFTKLEGAGAFSKLETLLPIADDLNLLATAENLLNVPAGNLGLAAFALLAGEAGLIAVVPDDSTALVAFQLLTGVAAGAGAVTLFATSSLFSLLQAED